VTTDNQLTIAKLKNKLKSVLEYSQKYSPENLKKIQEIEKSLDKQEFKIGIVANMSAGKSTFINALFGKNILPAFNHATTDCATIIHSEKDIDKKAIITFHGDKPSVKLSELELDELKKYAQKDSEISDQKYMDVESIDLYYPFSNIQTENQDNIKILFIDTPGPNNTGEYSQKHKNQTRKVLRDIDLALFIFDFQQLDTNLTSDEQGLWHTIQERYTKEKDFEIFFLLNKIDLAWNDNFKEAPDDDQEYLKFLQRNWLIHETKAIDKLRDAAQKHKISEPKIFPLSAEYAIYQRSSNRNNRNKMLEFEQTFKDKFPERWEEELINYLGISKLEEGINHYVNTTVEEKIANKLSQTLEKIINEENADLQRKEQTLKKPQEEAEKNLKNAKVFIQETAAQLEQEMKSNSSKIKEKYKKEIIHLIGERIETELRSKAEEIATRSIYFARALSKYDVIRASTITNDMQLNDMEIDLNTEKIKVTLRQAIEPNVIKTEMDKFLLNLFHDCKRRYLDVRSDIKECYHNFDMEADDLLENYKRELENNLNSKLDVKIDDIQKETIERVNMPEFEIDVPDSVLDYKFKSEERETTWYKPWSWWNGEKIRDEQHEMILEPKKILESIKAGVEKNIANFYQNEIGIHEANIDLYLDQFVEVFQDFRRKKVSEIHNLSKEVKDSESQLKALVSRKQEFQKNIIGV
jgi:small GTP-binding protein